MCPPLDTAIRSQIDDLDSQVTQLRGFRPLNPVTLSLLTENQLRERVITDFFADYTEEDAKLDVRLLSLLDLIEPQIDLYQLYVDLYSEQIAGFYDPETGELVVICGAGFGGVERFSYVHEYTHALQDQLYDLEEGLDYNDDDCEDESERCFALQSLIEGDATLLQEQWLRTFAGEDDLSDLIAFDANTAFPVFDRAPAYIQSQLTFPYFWGLNFVRTLYLEGGWAAVDEAYQNPPLSSEQILHPERYPWDSPVSLIVPDAVDDLSSSWDEIVTDEMGEWVTLMVLEEYLPADDAALAAEGWGGDYLLFFSQEEGDANALVLVTQWDTMRDAHESFAAFRDYGTVRFGDPEYPSTTSMRWVFDGGLSYFERVSNQTLWILAPDELTMENLRQVVHLPTKTDT
jgi:hypothetical protein